MSQVFCHAIKKRDEEDEEMYDVSLTEEKREACLGRVMTTNLRRLEHMNHICVLYLIPNDSFESSNQKQFLNNKFILLNSPYTTTWEISAI